MNKDFDEAIAALIDNQPALAILLIEKVIERRVKAQAEEFKLQMEQAELAKYERTTDFLGFQGWEAA